MRCSGGLGIGSSARSVLIGTEGHQTRCGIMLGLLCLLFIRQLQGLRRGLEGKSDSIEQDLAGKSQRLIELLRHPLYPFEQLLGWHLSGTDSEQFGFHECLS